MSKTPEFWEVDEKNVESAKGVITSRYGLLASVPMICRGSKCPFYEACFIPRSERKKGERCPIEVATILDRFERYVKQLNVEEDNIVDLSLIRELVDIEVQMVRADMKLAIDADFVEQVVAGIDQQGQAWHKPELHKAVDYKDRLRRERHRILDLLASTRKNASQHQHMDPSTMAAVLMKKMQERTGKDKGEGEKDGEGQ